MKQKIRSNITVSPNDAYVVWEENLENIACDTTVNVETGCVVFYKVNGILTNTLSCGQWCIKSKAEEREHSRLQLIAANLGKSYPITIAVDDIPFSDSGCKEAPRTNVRICATCTIRMSSPWQLYTAFSKTNITLNDIIAYLKPKYEEIMVSYLAQELQYLPYNDIPEQRAKFSEKLKVKFAAKCKEIGLEIQDLTNEGIQFSSDYQKCREKLAAEELVKKKKEAEAQKKIEDVIRIVQATQSPNKCPKCGTDISKSGGICPVCNGKK